MHATQIKLGECVFVLKNDIFSILPFGILKLKIQQSAIGWFYKAHKWGSVFRNEWGIPQELSEWELPVFYYRKVFWSPNVNLYGKDLELELYQLLDGSKDIVVVVDYL